MHSRTLSQTKNRSSISCKGAPLINICKEQGARNQHHQEILKTQGKMKRKEESPQERSKQTNLRFWELSKGNYRFYIT